MPTPTFSQPERRSYLVPALITLVLVAIVATLIYKFTPHRIADIAVTRVNAVSIGTPTKTGSQLVGKQEFIQNDLYVLATVRIDDQLRLPLFLKDITATLTTPDGDLTTSAIEKNDLDSIYTTFPQVKSVATAPLFRDTAVEPQDHAEGMVLLHFPITQQQWDQRTTATITLTFYSQGEFTIPIPKT
jgi:hypothetical protein